MSQLQRRQKGLVAKQHNSSSSPVSAAASLPSILYCYHEEDEEDGSWILDQVDPPGAKEIGEEFCQKA